MQVLVLSGSRNRQGKTARVINAILKGVGQCIIEDDFASIMEKIKAADVLVFATPVYFGDLSESMRGFLDRFRRTRFIRRPPVGQGVPGVPPYGESTTAIGLCYAGGSGNGNILSMVCSQS